MNFSSKLFAYDNLFFEKHLYLPVGILFQVSELSVIRSGEILEHIQTCDEITYVISGKAKMYTGDKCTEITGGQVHFIKKGIRHKIIADANENFRYICIGYIPNENCADIASFLETTENITDFIAEDGGTIRNLSRQLINEFYLRDEQSDVMINAYLVQILLSLYRILTNSTIAKEKTSSSTSNFAVYRTLRYMDQEYLNIASIKEIAVALNYSEYYLSHLFREKMGLTIKDYLTRKKMIAAENMLKTSNMSIQEIAEQLNYASAHSFSLAFKKYMSESPTTYRKKMTVIAQS